MSLMQLHAVDRKENYRDDLLADMEKVKNKTPEELARSMEVMVELVQPEPQTRIVLRGVICVIRGEPTNVPESHMIDSLTVLRDRWDKQKWAQRSYVVQRVIRIVGDYHGR